MFSVIIPAYNREKELVTCIESVLNQTYGEFELIVVDNGSTDGTKNVVQAYQIKDKRVRYYWQQNSGSPAGSRNTGIKHANFEWIAFLDSDDYWFDEKLEQVKQYIDAHTSESIVLISHYEEQHIGGCFDRVLEHGKWLKTDLFNELLYKGNCLSTSAVVARADTVRKISGFDTRRDYFAVEDYDLWMRMAKLGEFGLIKKPLGVFSISSNNMSGNIELINNNLKKLILDKIENLSVSHEEKKKLKKIHGARIDYYKGREYLLKKDFNNSRAILWQSFLDYPWSLKKVATLLFSIFKISK